MSDVNYLISILDSSRLSTLDKMNILNNIKDVIKTSSIDEAAASLTQAFEDLFYSKIEEIKEKLELREEGNFSTQSSGRPSFKRVQ